MLGISYLFVFFVYLSFSLKEISGNSLRNKSLQHDEAVKQNLENPCSNIMLDPKTNKYVMMFFPEVDYPCCPCNAGYRRVRPCKKDKPHTTQCVPCENGTFIDEIGHGHLTCKKKNVTCPEDQMFIPSTATTKPYCMCNHGYKVDEDDECQLHTECPPEFGVDVEGNPFRDTECIECQYGFEKPGFSSTARCKPTEKVINHPKNQHLNASVDFHPDSIHKEKQPRPDSFHSTHSITQAITSKMTVQKSTDNKHSLILGMKPISFAVVIIIFAAIALAAVIVYCKRKKSSEREETLPAVEYVQSSPSNNGTRIDEGEETPPQNRNQNNFNDGNSSTPNTTNTNEIEETEPATDAGRSENTLLLRGSAASPEDSSPRTSTRPSVKSNTSKSPMSWCQIKNSKKKNISSMPTLGTNSKSFSGSIENCSSSQVDNSILTNRHSYSDGIKVPLVKAEPFTSFSSSQQLSTSKLSPLNVKSKSMSGCDQAFRSSQEDSTKTHLCSYTGAEKTHSTETTPFMSEITNTSVPQIPPSPHPITASQTTVPHHNTSSTATRSSSTFSFSGHRAYVMHEIKKRLSKLVQRVQVREFFRDIRNHPTTPQTLEDLERIHRSTSEMFIAAFEKLMDLGSDRFNPQVLYDYFVSQENLQLAEIVQDFFEDYYRHESN